jgi:hypothetical protein
MPNPNTTQIKLRSNAKNSSATNPKKVKAKEGKVDKRAKKTAAIESDSDDDDDDDEDIEVVGTTKSNTVINPKRKLNETTNQTTGLRTLKAKNPSGNFKKVDDESRHRRRCKRFGEELRSRTPDRNNLSRYKNKHTTRFTFKITIPSTNKPEETLISIFSEFFQELKKLDDKLVILPWKTNDRSNETISKEANLPTSIKQIRGYLNRFYIGKNQNQIITTYPGVQIGYDRQFSEIRSDLQYWLNAGNHGLYERMLQVENSSEIGWLLYSTKAMDAGALVDEIAELVGIQVGLRWKIIDVGAKGKLPEAQRVHALNVDVDSNYRWEAQKKLSAYFGRAMKNQEEYPNGIRLRFVKSKRDALNSVEKSKIERLRARQKSFLSNILSTDTWDIVQLDYATDDNSPTLRQMIMSLTTKNDNIPLFHCVDLDWRGDGYTFQYSPQVRSEAECAVHTLYPLLTYHFPDQDIDDHFTTEILEKSQTLEYDKEKGVVIDKELGNQLDIIEDDNLLGFTFDLNSDVQLEGNEEIKRPSTQNFNKYFPNDSDSVSTFAKQFNESDNTFRPITPSRPSARRIQRSLQDMSPTTSVTSTVTMDTIHTMQSSIKQLSNNVLDNNRKFDLIMEKLGIKQGGQGSPLGAKDGTPNPSNSTAGRAEKTSSGEVLE